MPNIRISWDVGQQKCLFCSSLLTSLTQSLRVFFRNFAIIFPTINPCLNKRLSMQDENIPWVRKCHQPGMFPVQRSHHSRQQGPWWSNTPATDLVGKLTISLSKQAKNEVMTCYVSILARESDLQPPRNRRQFHWRANNCAQLRGDCHLRLLSSSLPQSFDEGTTSQGGNATFL